MKKIISTSLCLFMIFSCSTSNDSETSSQSLRIEKELRSYNESINRSASGMPKKGKFWKIVGVIAADVAGGALGSLINPVVGGVTAAAASGVAAASATAGGGDGGVGEPINPDFNVNYVVPDQYANCDIGDYHNDALANVFNGDMPIDQYLIENYGAETLEYYNSDSVQNVNNLAAEITVNYVEMGYDYSYMLSSYSDNNLISDNTKMVLSLFMGALFEASSDAQISDILNYYSQTVLASDELTDSDKASLFSAFSVARSSSNYWNNLN
ncbi:hypothetical protein [Flavobacterium sp.]|uniref:hypothetical protein n=1 Tax=Flavobacterium sp. TaxID=239 RepID=UPI00262EA9D3|nr:hypothetical protein [Flavobacterium sp.]